MLTTRPLRRPTPSAKKPILDALRPSPATAQQMPKAAVVARKPTSFRPDAFRGAKPRVLHIGCGVNSAARLHDIFKLSPWEEIRCDIDKSTRPDIEASIVDLSDWVEDGSCDAIWASHVIEHLARHEVPLAFAELVRVLSPTGFALVRSPDMEAIAQFVIEGRLADVIYTSPAGPITPLDMIYGHGAAIARGNHAMRHGTAFTQDLLGRDLQAAGFAEVRTARTKTYEVWGVAFMPEADSASLLDQLATIGIDFRG